jgi:hypothetical protein
MPTPKRAYSVWLALAPLKTVSWPWRFPWGRRRFAAGTVPEPRPPSASRRGAPAGSPRRRAVAPSAHRRRGQRWAWRTPAPQLVDGLHRSSGHDVAPAGRSTTVSMAACSSFVHLVSFGRLGTSWPLLLLPSPWALAARASELWQRHLYMRADRSLTDRAGCLYLLWRWCICLYLLWRRSIIPGPEGSGRGVHVWARPLVFRLPFLLVFSATFTQIIVVLNSELYVAVF